MSARVKAMIGSTVVEVEGTGVKEIIEALTPFYDVFGERECGKCGSQELAVNHRKAQSYDYYSLKCLACGCQLDFGQHQEGGTLFPKRKLPSGEYDSQQKGWYFWKDRQPVVDHQTTPPQAQNTYDPNDF